MGLSTVPDERPPALVVKAPVNAGDAGGAPSGRREQRKGIFALAILLVAVGSLWLATAARDLPYMHHPDEPVNLRVFNGMVEDGDLNPHFFIYPSLFVYVHAAVHLDGPILGWLGGDEDAPFTEVRGTTHTTTPSSVTVHRAVSVVMGLVTVVAVYGTTRLLTRRMVPALFAAAVMATSVTLGVNARLVTPDVVATALVACVLWASVQLWLRPTWGSHVLAGTMVGLSASSKYNAAIVAVTVVAAASLSAGLRGDSPSRALKLGASGLAAGTAFLVTTPYALLDRSTFLEQLRYQRQHYASGHPGMDGDAARWYAGYLLSTETLLIVVAALGLAVTVVWGRWRPGILLSAFPLVYGAFVAGQAVRNDRTILLVLPHLAVLAAFGGAVALERFAPDGLRSSIPLRNLTAGVVVLAVTALAVQGARLVARLNPPPTTYSQAREWIEGNVAAGSSVYIESYSPWVDPDVYEVGSANYLIGVSDLLAGDWSYLVASETAYSRFVDNPDRFPEYARRYEALFEQTRTVVRFEGEGPMISILQPRT